MGAAWTIRATTHWQVDSEKRLKRSSGEVEHRGMGSDLQKHMGSMLVWATMHLSFVVWLGQRWALRERESIHGGCSHWRPPKTPRSSLLWFWEKAQKMTQKKNLNRSWPPEVWPKKKRWKGKRELERGRASLSSAGASFLFYTWHFIWVELTI